MISLSRIFQPLEKFEQKMAETYEKLSQHFESDEEAAHLFARLSFEEKSHKSQVEYLHRVARRNSSRLGQISVDLDAIERESTAVERILDALDRATLRQIVIQLIHLEAGTAELQWHGALIDADPELAKMVRNYATGNRLHRQRLQEFAVRRGFDQDATLPPLD